MATFIADPAPSLAFARLYIQIVELLTQIWVHFQPTRNFSYTELGDLEYLLGKLEMKLRDIRYKFTGISEEVNLHILELLLVAFTLKLSRPDIYCHQVTLRNLTTVLSNIALLHSGSSIEPSTFITEVKNLLHDGKISSHTTFHFRKLLEQVSFTAFEVSCTMKYISAEIVVPGNDSENPIYFVCGLPVTIPVEVTLKNLGRDRRVWLKMVGGEKFLQFVFIDQKLLGECSEFMKFTRPTPFYRTPKATDFTVKVTVIMECLGIEMRDSRRCGGPKCEVTYLSPEKEVYLSSIIDR